MSEEQENGFVQVGRYGTNWHQKAWLRKDPNYQGASIPGARQVFGGPLGSNNYLDADSSLGLTLDFRRIDDAFSNFVKHLNACGAATGATLVEAVNMARLGDPVSAFGGIVTTNRPFDTASLAALKGELIEVIGAPVINRDVIETLEECAAKKEKDPDWKNPYGGIKRVLELGDLNRGDQEFEYKKIRGGDLKIEYSDRLHLAKSIDTLLDEPRKILCENSGEERPVGVVLGDIGQATQNAGLYEFALKHVKHCLSNSISICREYAPGKYQVLGVGVGQPNRVISAGLAIDRAIATLSAEYDLLKPTNQSKADYIIEWLKKSVAASEAFYPFSDGPKKLADAGIRHFLEPGGALRDKEVIEALKAYENLVLVFTGVRLFKH